MKVFNVDTQKCIDTLDSIKDKKFIKFLKETYPKYDFDIYGDLCLEDWENELQYKTDKEYFYLKDK